ncbi:hypothetical protein J3459_010574 [Metarhizium acridum]|uniref:uncharacterized protein n=2 Tax=Metarhizium acridum TaxID=92637 RepID=UPI001C6CABB7|nr:hypothetical protein J3458_020805 [Metarhizium acridum]KAG8422235.1 hypothetical protein J3459_010574 [Metarhizium acridum]
MDPKAIDTLTVDASQNNKDAENNSKQLDDRASDSDVLSAAGVDMSGDDPNLPCLTLRMWFIGIGFCIIGSGVNTLYTFRFPSVSLSQSAIQFLAYPVGKAWELVVPDWGITVFGTRHSLNPCRFNHKENILIYILANLSYMTRLSADVLTEQRVFYGLEAGWGFELMITLATILFGFGFAGLARSLVVEPPELVWPGVLGNTALNSALHGGNSKQNVSSHACTWRSTRYKFFLWTFTAGFVWYWFPDLIFPALGYFTWICWIAPKNAVVNQVFGMKSGMGLLPFTFDWSQISYIGSPLIVPTWVIFNILAAVVFWIWIITPALYYSNTWLSAYLPLQSNSIFDNSAKVYNVSRVINAKNGFTFDEAKFAAYSDIRLPVTYALNKFGLAFATFASLFTWLFLEKRRELGGLVRQVRETKLWPNRASDTHGEKSARQDWSSRYPQAPLWWYGAATLLGLFFAMFSCEYYAVQLRWYGAILAFVISAVFFIPIAWVFATTNTRISIELFCRLVAGYLWEGKVLANIWFFSLGSISTTKGLAFAQDLKLGIYCNIPPRHLFLVQAVGLVVGTVSQVAVINWALNHIPNICTFKAANGFTCPFSRTHFNTSMVWGAVGPRKFFAPGASYRPLLWFFLLGFLLPIAVYGLRRVFPNAKWLRRVHVPLFLGGMGYIPPASGTNYGAWVVVGLLFGLLVKRNYKTWWNKYNFVLSAALDCSTAIAGILIFFAVIYTGASKDFSWWGTTVHTNTCDWKACRYLKLAKGAKMP